MKHLMCFRWFTIMFPFLKSQHNDSLRQKIYYPYFIDKETKLKEAKQFYQGWLRSF